MDGQVHLLSFDVHHPDRKPAVVKIHEDVDHLTVSDLFYVSSKQVAHLAYFVLISQLTLRKENILRKHSLHAENSSLGFIKAVYKWK